MMLSIFMISDLNNPHVFSTTKKIEPKCDYNRIRKNANHHKELKFTDTQTNQRI